MDVAIEDKKTTEHQRRIKTAELAVEQAKLRTLSHEVKGAERALEHLPTLRGHLTGIILSRG
jgi:hypothetical protein